MTRHLYALLCLCCASALVTALAQSGSNPNPEGLPVVPMNRDAALAGSLPSASGMQTQAFDDASKQLLEVLRKKLPGTTFTEVTKSPLDGVFMVRMGRNIAYTDATGRHFLFGHLYDMDTREDLTAQALQQAPAIRWEALPLKDAIQFGSGSLKLAVFSDPDCPFCRQLELQLIQLKGVEIHVFLFPIEGLHKGATEIAQHIWCAPNRAKAWHEYTLNNKRPARKNCPHPVARTLALADKLGLNSTPTLISGDGRVVSGAASAQEIMQWLRGELPTNVSSEGATR
jgi:thiol:disulfide interchange protein DsbC